MKRECIWTGVGCNKQIEDVYGYFKDGWILDPWLHKTDRPWTLPRTQILTKVDPPGIDKVLQTAHVWNLILLEEDDDPTDPEWILKNCPVRDIPIPKADVTPMVSPIVDEKLISYDEVAGLVVQGYEMPEDRRWAKNRLAVLRLDVVADMANRQGIAPLVKDLLELIPTQELQDYLNARAEVQPTEVN